MLMWVLGNLLFTSYALASEATDQTSQEWENGEHLNNLLYGTNTVAFAIYILGLIFQPYIAVHSVPCSPNFEQLSSLNYYKWHDYTSNCCTSERSIAC